MNMLQCCIILTACLASVAAALPGTFLVLRGMALMSDAISHAILPGIVIMFLLTHKLESPLLIVGASIAGMLTVVLTESLIQTKRIKKDAAIGLIFPLFFSTGVILISLFARNVHLDVDMVLLGEIAFTLFDHLIINGFNYGPYALWSMGTIALLNCILVFVLYKELKVTTFDPHFAHSIGFSPSLLHYGIMLVTSITAVGAFDIVGSIVVVALMIAPPATAYLLTKQLHHMIGLTLFIAVISSINGYLAAALFDVSIAGSIAIANGVIFLLALLFAPAKGILYKIIFSRKENLETAQTILCCYLNKKKQHTKIGVPLSTIAQELGWNKNYAQRVINHSLNNKTISNINNTFLKA
ncbi:metal ABC transporter permease [Candidatus Dependentiae bacterium]|nr:metal ABC transporter permease [Candidatus Dependentiae bacterium]